MIPAALALFQKTGAEFTMESGAGLQAGFPDAEYAAKGVQLANRQEVFRTADVLLQVRSPGANPSRGEDDTDAMQKGQTVIGFGEPLTSVDATRLLAER